MGKHNITASWSNAANDTLVFLSAVDHDNYFRFIHADLYSSNRHFSVVAYVCICITGNDLLLPKGDVLVRI